MFKIVFTWIFLLFIFTILSEGNCRASEPAEGDKDKDFASQAADAIDNALLEVQNSFSDFFKDGSKVKPKSRVKRDDGSHPQSAHFINDLIKNDGHLMWRIGDKKCSYLVCYWGEEKPNLMKGIRKRGSTTTESMLIKSFQKRTGNDHRDMAQKFKPQPTERIPRLNEFTREKYLERSQWPQIFLNKKKDQVKNSEFTKDTSKKAKHKHAKLSLNDKDFVEDMSLETLDQRPKRKVEKPRLEMARDVALREGADDDNVNDPIAIRMRKLKERIHNYKENIEMKKNEVMGEENHIISQILSQDSDSMKTPEEIPRHKSKSNRKHKSKSKKFYINLGSGEVSYKTSKGPLRFVLSAHKLPDDEVVDIGEEIDYPEVTTENNEKSTASEASTSTKQKPAEQRKKEKQEHGLDIGNEAEAQKNEEINLREQLEKQTALLQALTKFVNKLFDENQAKQAMLFVKKADNEIEIINSTIQDEETKPTEKGVTVKEQHNPNMMTKAAEAIDNALVFVKNWLVDSLKSIPFLTEKEQSAPINATTTTSTSPPTQKKKKPIEEEFGIPLSYDEPHLRHSLKDANAKSYKKISKKRKNKEYFYDLEEE